MSASKHKSLMTRPKDIRDEWGGYNARDFARYFLQGFPGIGSERAVSIFDHFGRVPLRWDVTEEDLRGVPMIGEKTAASLTRYVLGRERPGREHAERVVRKHRKRP